jgi:hypothetical protein
VFVPLMWPHPQMILRKLSESCRVFAPDFA